MTSYVNKMDMSYYLEATETFLLKDTFLFVAKTIHGHKEDQCTTCFDTIIPLHPSSETQGQLVGTTGFSWAKVYNKSGRAPGHLLLPNEFQKRLKSRLLIGQKIFFLANQRRLTAGRLSCLLTRGCFPHQSP